MNDRTVPDPVSLLEQVAALRLENGALRAENAALTERIREPEARLGQTSANSSGKSLFRPTTHPREAAGAPAGRNRGGQPGHRGAFRALLPVDQVDEMVVRRAKLQSVVELLMVDPASEVIDPGLPVRWWMQQTIVSVTCWTATELYALRLMVWTEHGPPTSAAEMPHASWTRVPTAGGPRRPRVRPVRRTQPRLRGRGADAAAPRAAPYLADAAWDAVVAAAKQEGKVTILSMATQPEAREVLAEGFRARYPEIEVDYNFVPAGRSRPR